MDITLLANNEDYEHVLEVMLQLRPQYNKKSLAEQIKKQQQTGYNIVYVKDNGKVLAVAGFVIGEKLAWGKYLYVDDLVTNEAFRSAGVGHNILAWLEDFAKEQGCTQLHLDSGVQRYSAHKFYLREGFVIASHHFSKTELL
ncbi:GNAT family N-acetyltransferase [Thalassotalea sp. 1_MG-2023]|uniref:GNAT family N-acetyltransferase n=1 Tax=Thalassotalea sp. 1_MG-2023 TaxID=3062680 RepID=UPI0026E38AB0|nr:GNAT family N-acetyltransferase [Thalassotalea sp. 1_MG-2023]MDO6428581.1 GNAT family N-acetyltransferase [Thalassotalea sp. 1_MG-2023]